MSLALITEQKKYAKNIRIVSNLINCLRICVATLIVISVLTAAQKNPQKVAKNSVVTKH
jgi:hypothetical protein